MHDNKRKTQQSVRAKAFDQASPRFETQSTSRSYNSVL
jgi:hypothetical protein